MKIMSIILTNLDDGGSERFSLTLDHGFKERGYLMDLVLMRAEGDLVD